MAALVTPPPPILVPPWLTRSARAIAVIVVLSAGAAAGAEGDVLALLETRCVQCHGGEKTKAGLDLTTREALLRGGETGAAIATDRPETSLLLQTIRHETDPHMPHKKEKLPPAEMAEFEAWGKAGVPYARPLKKTTVDATAKSAEFPLTEDDRRHWAFQPIGRPEPPAVRHEALVANPIDRFIL